MKRVKRVDIDRMSVKQFNAICTDFHGITVHDIDYIGFMHTLLYAYIENSVFDETKIDELYNSLVDFC